VKPESVKEVERCAFPLDEHTDLRSDSAMSQPMERVLGEPHCGPERQLLTLCHSGTSKRPRHLSVPGITLLPMSSRALTIRLAPRINMRMVAHRTIRLSSSARPAGNASPAPACVCMCACACMASLTRRETF
jgi:hypothetical protein